MGIELPELVCERPVLLDAGTRVRAERRYWHLSTWRSGQCGVSAVSGQSDLLPNH